MISLYLEQQSWLHRLPTSAKLIALALSSVALLTVASPWIMLAALLGTILIYLSLAPQGWRHLSAARPLIPFLLAILVIHYLTDTLVEGCVSLGRLLTLFLVANLVTLTTRMSDMINTLQPCFKPLQLFGIQPRSLALAIALMIRFAPVLAKVLESLDEAWRARGGGKQKWRLLVPLIIQGITLSEHVADALAARGGSAGLNKRI